MKATTRSAGSDVGTGRRGRPYTLVGTDNRTGYERRVVQRQRDLADIAALETVQVADGGAAAR